MPEWVVRLQQPLRMRRKNKLTPYYVKQKSQTGCLALFYQVKIKSLADILLVDLANWLVHT